MIDYDDGLLRRIATKDKAPKNGGQYPRHRLAVI